MSGQDNRLQIPKGYKSIPLRLKKVAEKLTTPETAEKFFGLYKKGLPKKKIAQALCVPVEAFDAVFGDLDWGRRGKITFFINKNQGKWREKFEAKLEKSKGQQKEARKKRVERNEENARLRKLKEERKSDKE